MTEWGAHEGQEGQPLRFRTQGRKNPVLSLAKIVGLKNDTGLSLGWNFGPSPWLRHMPPIDYYWKVVKENADFENNVGFSMSCLTHLLQKKIPFPLLLFVTNKTQIKKQPKSAEDECTNHCFFPPASCSLICFRPYLTSVWNDSGFCSVSFLFISSQERRGFFSPLLSSFT